MPIDPPNWDEELYDSPDEGTDGLAPGDFQFVSTEYFKASRGVCCFTCPAGYILTDELSIDVVLDDSREITGNVLTFSTDPMTSTPLFSASIEATSFILQCVEGPGGLCYEDGTRTTFLVLGSAPGGATAATAGGYKRVDGCQPGELVDNTQNITPQTTDTRRLDSVGPCYLSCYGREWRDLDITFRINFNQAPLSPTMINGWARVRGRLCVEHGDCPPIDWHRYWCVPTRTYNAEWGGHVELVQGGTVLDREDFAPTPFLSGPHFKTLIPEMGPYNPCHLQDIVCSAPAVYWEVEYQNYDGSGNPVGPPYPGVYQNASETEIITREENLWLLPSCTMNGRDDLADLNPSWPRTPTVQTGQDLDTTFDNPAGSVVRTRTYVDGWWPTAQLACLSAPDCPQAHLGPKRPNYLFGNPAWVTQDWGKASSMTEGTVFELDQYLRCRCGHGYKTPNEHGIITYAQKTCVRNIVGAPAETISQDDDNDGDGFDHILPAVFGEWNQGAPDLWAEPGPDGWPAFPAAHPFNGFPSWPAAGDYPNKWLVLPSLYADETRFEVIELPYYAFEDYWLAPADTRGYATEAEALAAAADMDGVWFCVKVQDYNSSNEPIGPVYQGCLGHTDLPLPDPQTEPPMARLIYEPYPVVDTDDDGFDLSQPYRREHMPVPAFSSNAGADHSTVWIVDGPWMGVTGIGPDKYDQCRQNCPPCGSAPVCEAPAIESLTLTPDGLTVALDATYSGSGADGFAVDWGDGSVPEEHTPETLPDPLEHEYAEAGEYTVTLGVSGACGSVEASDTVEVSA